VTSLPVVRGRWLRDDPVRPPKTAKATGGFRFAGPPFLPVDGGVVGRRSRCAPSRPSKRGHCR
jgi:hypothetical protein